MQMAQKTCPVLPTIRKMVLDTRFFPDVSGTMVTVDQEIVNHFGTLLEANYKPHEALLYLYYNRINDQLVGQNNRI